MALLARTLSLVMYISAEFILGWLATHKPAWITELVVEILKIERVPQYYDVVCFNANRKLSSCPLLVVTNRITSGESFISLNLS